MFSKILFCLFLSKPKKSKFRDSSLLEGSILEQFLSLTFYCIFKTVGVTALPVNPFLSPKSGEHDVTFTSFAGDLSQPGS